MAKYNVGDIVTAKEEIELTSELTERKVVIKKGTKGWVTASSPFTIRWQSGQFQIITGDEDTKIVGFNVEGIAEFVYLYMRNTLPLDELMEDYDIAKDDIIENIGEALFDLGFHSGETNSDSEGENDSVKVVLDGDD